MVAPVAQGEPPLNAFMLAQRGVPVVVEYQGEAGGVERVRITAEAQVFALVSGLLAACGRSERAHWRDRVRLGVVLNQLKAQLRSGRTGTMFAELGVHPGLGRACMRLARLVADERGVIDEASLAAAIAEHRRRDRGEREEDVRQDDAPTMGGNAGATAKSPELVETPEDAESVLTTASLREVERAVGMRRDGRRGGPHPTGQHSEHEQNRSFVSSPPVTPGRAETHVRGFSEDGRRDAAPTGPASAGERWAAGPQMGAQLKLDELYRAAEDVAHRCRAVAGLPTQAIADRLGEMTTDELESVLDALALLGARGT